MKWLEIMKERIDETVVEGEGYGIQLDAWALIQALQVAVTALQNIDKLSTHPDTLITPTVIGTFVTETLKELEELGKE